LFEIGDGEIGMLPGHAPFTAPIETSVLHIKEKKGERKLALISDGIAEVKKHKTVILADSANWPEEINIEWARMAKDEAEKIIEGNNFKLDTEKAKKKLKRAQTRIKLYRQMQDLLSKAGHA
jgi:F-type H+-transporting ATPase subunit epsilon